MFEGMIVGRLGKDAELKTFNNGGTILKFSVAIDRFKRVNGQNEKYTQWFDVELADGIQEGVRPYLKKGTQVLVLADVIESRAWIAADGTAQSALTMKYVTKIKLLGSKDDNRHEQEDQNQEQPRPASKKPATKKSAVEDEVDDSLF